MRELVYNVLQDDSNVTIYDSRSLNWSTFKFSSKFKRHTLTKDEILRPYLVSANYYGTIDYEDILLILNNIEDIFDVIAGTEIIIPDKQEIDDFILANKK